MFALHRKHTYGPPRPVTGIALCFSFYFTKASLSLVHQFTSCKFHIELWIACKKLSSVTASVRCYSLVSYKDDPGFNAYNSYGIHGGRSDTEASRLQGALRPSLANYHYNNDLLSHRSFWAGAISPSATTVLPSMPGWRTATFSRLQTPAWQWTCRLLQSNRTFANKYKG
jgi:hypothetical protein